MNFPFLASTIILCLLLNSLFRKNSREAAKQEENFWDRERRANLVRRQPLDQLNYITVPLESFPTGLLAEDEEVADCIHTIQHLSQEKIVNFTGYTNTDLKLEYGAPNINLLTQYDQNYTLLVRTLQKWAELLLSAGYEAQAVILMEFAVRTGTDVRRTYYALADYYRSSGNTQGIRSLLQTAQQLRSLNREPIVRTLQESYL